MAVRRHLVVLLTLSLALAGCDFDSFRPDETGSGNLITETRSVGEFSAIEVSSAINLDLTVGEPTAVTVTFDDNLLDNLVTDVRGDTLHIELNGSISFGSADRRVVVVTMPNLRELTASGATDVIATGATGNLRLILSGAANAELGELIAEDVDVDASGASDITVHATGDVTGSASGASDVTIVGDPDSVDISTSGASSVETP